MGSSGDLHSTGHSEERNSFDVSPWAELSVQGLHTLAPSLGSREPQGAHSLVGRATGLTALQTPNPAHGAQAPSLQLIVALSQTLPAALPSLTPLPATPASLQQLAKLPPPWSLQMNAIPSAWTALPPTPPCLSSHLVRELSSDLSHYSLTVLCSPENLSLILAAHLLAV